LRASVVNICSEALDLLKFSTDMALENAWSELDYILILWEPSKEVKEYAKFLEDVIGAHCFYYKTKPSLSFIENLRGCFNLGREKAFEFNDYSCIINTDMAFYRAWLANLVAYARPDAIINCRQIEPRPTPFHEVKDFGVPGVNFNLKAFNEFCFKIYVDKLVDEKEWGRRADATPHLIHKSVWEEVGEWNVKENPADVMWFDRAKKAGIKNLKSLGSIVYHFGAVETRRRR